MPAFTIQGKWNVTLWGKGLEENTIQWESKRNSKACAETLFKKL